MISTDKEIVIDNSKIENERRFVYLRTLLTWDNNCTEDIAVRVAKAKGVMGGFSSI